MIGFKDKHVLLLQGQIGPYFRRLASQLRAQGATVTKLNFNGGDWLFCPGGINYRGRMENLPAAIEALVVEKKIDVIMLFGDCRPVHEHVHEIAHRHGVDMRVFEEGYVRPDFITCERSGVNGYSPIPRSAAFYRSLPELEDPKQDPIGKTYWHMAAWAVLYYTAAGLLRPLYPFYTHHRPLGVAEGFPWIRSAWRKAFYRFKERGLQEWLCSNKPKAFYLVPLQVHNDTQVTVHSKYESVDEFISETLVSFAKHAPDDTLLVFKHHPMDRAYRDYTRLIRAKVAALGISGRVFYIHDQHLPTLLGHAKGAVVINSTVGLSAIHQGVPTKVCGDALYDFAGLTYGGALDDFWSNTDKANVDTDLYRRFRNYLIRATQINGSFYKEFPRKKERHEHAQKDCGYPRYQVAAIHHHSA